jgi:hypothetical protein
MNEDKVVALLLLCVGVIIELYGWVVFIGLREPFGLFDIVVGFLPLLVSWIVVYPTNRPVNSLEDKHD